MSRGDSDRADSPGGSGGRDDLFDLAVNRALVYARRTRALERARDLRSLTRELELWALRTRFAYRFRLEEVAERLRTAPAGEVHWEGGPAGTWRDGPPPRP